MDARQTGFSTSLLPPTGLEVRHRPSHPQLRAPRGRTLTLALAEGLAQAPTFQPDGNYDTNEKSVNQRVTCGQEDGFDTLPQLQSSLSFVESKDERD